MPNAQFYINKYEAIPEEEWVTHFYVFVDKKSNIECHCALGHLGAVSQESMTEHATELVSLFRTKLGQDPRIINDRKTVEFPQDHPKYRILAALHQIKKLDSQE